MICIVSVEAAEGINNQSPILSKYKTDWTNKNWEWSLMAPWLANSSVLHYDWPRFSATQQVGPCRVVDCVGGARAEGVVWSWNEMRGWLSASWSVWGVQSWGVAGWSLGFRRSLWFGWFKASHLEVRHHLVGNLSEDRLSQSRWGSLEGEREM